MAEGAPKRAAPKKPEPKKPANGPANAAAAPAPKPINLNGALQDQKKAVPRPLDKQLEDSKTTLEKAERLLAKTRDEIKAMEKANGEITKSSEDFTKKWLDLKTRKDVVVEYFTSLREKFRSYGDTINQRIMKKIEEVDNEINAKTAEVEELEKELASKDKFRFSPAQKVFDERKAEYDNIKGLPTQIDAKLKAIEAIKKQVETAEKAQNYSNMYFLLDYEGDKDGIGSMMKEFMKLTGDLSCFSVQQGKEPADEAVKADFKKLLEQKWQGFYVASRQFNEARDDRARTEEQYKLRKAELDKLRKERSNLILEGIKNIKIKEK